jgi:hypothetical protein
MYLFFTKTYFTISITLEASSIFYLFLFQESGSEEEMPDNEETVEEIMQ